MPRPNRINGAPCWIDLFSSDTDKARTFYAALFGWTSEDAGADYGNYINFLKDGKPIAGCMRNDGTTGRPDLWTVYLQVADARATADAAVARGAQVVVPPMDVHALGTMAILGDPAGDGVGLWQPGEHKGFDVVAEPGAPAWFELHTRDYDAAVSFYTDVFGWDAHVAGDSPEFRYTTLGEGDSSQAGIMDASVFPPDAPTGWSIYFGVDDVDATLKHVTTLGGTVVMEAQDTPYGRLATAADPTGTSFKLRG